MFQDIRPDAVKMGMVSSAGLIRVIAGSCANTGAQNVVVDPVMVSTSGSRLLEEATLEALREQLLPLAAVVTPNIPRRRSFPGRSIPPRRTWRRLPGPIGDAYGCAVLCKGGHALNDANDCCMPGAAAGGSGASGSTTPTPTAPAAPSPAPSPPTWPRACDLETAVAAGQGSTSPGLCPPCWTWAGSGPLDHVFSIPELDLDRIRSLQTHAGGR